MFLPRLKILLKRSFTWWNGQSWGTWLFTKRHGHLIGSDDFGNKYYQTQDKSRRWVIYPHYSEASSIPPNWHAWLHKMINTPPSEQEFKQKSWEKPHLENSTGTPNAYVPPSSLSNPNITSRNSASGDYESWSP